MGGGSIFYLLITDTRCLCIWVHTAIEYAISYSKEYQGQKHVKQKKCPPFLPKIKIPV